MSLSCMLENNRWALVQDKEWKGCPEVKRMIAAAGCRLKTVEMMMKGRQSYIVDGSMGADEEDDGT